MFKLICDLEKQAFELATMTNSTMLRYNNCSPCEAVNYKLTSASKLNLPSIVQKFTEQWSNNGLSPFNQAYKDTYDKLLPENDLSPYKYIGLFEDNNRLPTLIDLGNAHNIAPIYESIYKGSDEMIWGKSNYLQFQTLPTLKPGIFKQLKTGDFQNSYIIDPMFLDFLEEKGWTTCTPLSYGERAVDDYSNYVTNIYAQVKQQVIKSTSQIKTCKVAGINVAMIDGSVDLSQQQDIEMLCFAMGGTLPSVYELVASFCAEDHDFVIAGNELFNISCSNYQNTLSQIGLGESLLHNEL